MKHSVGVVGTGFVGTAVSTGLQRIAEIREHDKFKPSESLHAVVNNSDIIFLALPTPMNEDGSCDASIVVDTTIKAAQLAEKHKIFVIKSTVPPGTTDDIQAQLPGHTVLFNPEFLTEAKFIQDFVEQNRIILGFTDFASDKDVQKVSSLYESFAAGQECPANILVTKAKPAEMMKYVTNCFLATKVAFFNEMKEVCDAAKIDYASVIKMIELDKRIGKTHMNVPGPDGKKGFGGSCFPKDLNALIAFAEENDVDPLVLESVWSKNLMIREECEWENLAQVTGDYE